MKQLPLLIVMLAFISLSSCQNSSNEKAGQNTSAFNLDSAKQNIERQNIAFQTAFENSDSVGLGNLFTTDAKMMMPGSPSIEGRAAITSVVAKFMKMKVKRTAATIGVWGNNDLLTEEGTASLFDQKGTELDHAKYLVIWKKENGEWKLFRDMWNSDGTTSK